MELIIVAVVAFIAGFKISEIIHVVSFKRVLQDLGIRESRLRELARDKGIDLPSADSEPEPAAAYEIRVEQHGDQLYAYKMDGEFLAQGTTQEALIERIAQRFKNVRFTVREGADLLRKNNS